MENAQRVSLRGNVHRRAIPQNDVGAIEPNFPVQGITLHLAPSAQQQAALDTLLTEQQDPASANFHKWLTPEQFADRFGASSADVAKLTGWLESQGFAVDHAARGRNAIVFSGTAAQVASAFQTPIHRFRDRGETHYANVAEPALPVPLANIVGLIGGLDDFFPTPASKPQLKPSPEFNAADGSHRLAPDDLALIYDVAPLYASGIDGTGQSIVVVGTSRASLSDLRAFRSTFNLPPLVPTLVLVPGFADPGVSATAGETALDLQWTGAIARGAAITYVYSTSIVAAIAYSIDQNLAPVMSVSFVLGCEQDNSPSFLSAIQNLARQANAQGITWVNGSGDAGAAGCEFQGTALGQNGSNLTVPAGIPEVTVVGGTQFDDSGGTYWNPTNDANGASAMGYIPERAWNDTPASHVLLATGGGTSTFFFKPLWQVGQGVPTDGFRDSPDVALSAASHDPFFVYYGGGPASAYGTSASTPVFAGMVALLNQAVAPKAGQAGLGNINPMLYRMAQTFPAAFHDITTGDNVVPCAAGSTGCSVGSYGYAAAPGYDQATGLGSVDLNLLVHQWSTLLVGTTAGSSLQISVNQNPVYQGTPDANGFSWFVTFTVNNEGSGSATLTSFAIGGVNHLNYFANTNIPGQGSITASVGFKGVLNTSLLFGFSGFDATGQPWGQLLTLPFVAAAPIPGVTGVANAASFQTIFAPGMQMAVFGSEFISEAPQAASAVPLLTYMDHFYATINNVPVPLYYVSPGQVNVQIPYETQPGPATLLVVSADGFKSSTYHFGVSSSAPGIFADGNGFTVPFRTGTRGQTLILFITGEGQVSPALATGESPPATTPVFQLPRPRLSAKMTIGGVDAPIQFIGIPSGLVGVTQVNFQIPPDAPLGDQPVIVTIGTVDSAPAKITVTP
ncbi:MAG TPA: protease pro-enzyme activation domain-containing protein [Bryobacteraceae bacterium]